MTTSTLKNPVKYQSYPKNKQDKSANFLFSIAHIFKKIISNKVTGKITIRDPNEESVFWIIYVGNGQIHFATSTMGQKERLAYFMQLYYPELEFNGEEFKSDYEQVCKYWQSGKLSIQQTRRLLFLLSQDALIQLLTLPKAVVKFEKIVGLDPILLSASIKELVLPMKGAIGQWKKLRPEFSSPFDRVVIKNIKELPKMLWKSVKSIDFLKALCRVLSKNICVYEAAKQLKTDTLALACLLQPLVRAGVLEVQPYCCPINQQKSIIACIDDSKTVQRGVKMVLEASGYRVLSVTEPAKALSAMVRHKPALVLMDINMPEINGYELGRMLRKSKQFQTLPIVMLTGRDGLIDKIRAQMLGANDYITKPVPPQMLLNIVEQNLNEQKQQKPEKQLKEPKQPKEPNQKRSLGGETTMLQMA